METEDPGTMLDEGLVHIAKRIIISELDENKIFVAS